MCSLVMSLCSCDLPVMLLNTLVFIVEILVCLLFMVCCTCSIATVFARYLKILTGFILQWVMKVITNI